MVSVILTFYHLLHARLYLSKTKIEFFFFFFFCIFFIKFIIFFFFFSGPLMNSLKRLVFRLSGFNQYGKYQYSHMVQKTADYTFVAV